MSNNSKKVNDRNYVDESKAEAIKKDVVGKYERQHKGNTSITHNAKVVNDLKVGAVEHKIIAKNVTKTYKEYSAIDIATDTTKTATSTTYEGDYTLKTPKSERQYNNVTLRATKGVNLATEKTVMTAKTISQKFKEIETNVETCQIFGDTHITSNEVNFGNAEPEESNQIDNFSVDAIAGDLVANALSSNARGDSKDQPKNGLHCLSVIPKWRKNTPDNNSDANDISNIKILERISSTTRSTIFQYIISVYTADSAAEDCKLIVPSDVNNWETLITKGYEQKIAGLENEKALNNSKGLDVVRAAGEPNLATLNFAAGVWGVEKIAVRKPFKIKNDILEQKITNIKQKQKTRITHITKLITDDLYFHDAETIRTGYVYVFLKCPEYTENGCNPYTQTRLYKEYYVIASDDNTISCSEVSLNIKSIGKDLRHADKGFVPKLEIPAVLIDGGGTQHTVETTVMYSEVQLSWPRVAKLGGIDPSDERVTRCDNVVYRDTIQNADATLLPKQAKPIDGSKLKDHYNLQLSASVEYNVQRMLIQTTQEQWSQEDLFFKRAYDGFGCKDYDSCVLVDDPMGMLLQSVSTVIQLQKGLNDILNKIDSSIEFKTAVLTQQSFFNPKAMGLIEFSGEDMLNKISHISDKNCELYKKYTSEWSGRIGALTKISKGSDKLDERKVNYALRKNSREIIKKLCQNQQLNGLDSIEYLSEHLANTFSQGVEGLGSAYSDTWGKLSTLAKDPNSCDAQLNISDIPIDSVVVTKSSWTSSSNFSLTVEHTSYHLEGFSVFKDITTYSTTNDEQTSVNNHPRTVYKTLEMPKSLDKLLNETLQLPSIKKMLLPNEASPTSEPTAKEIYYKADGRYSGELLEKATDYILDKSVNVASGVSLVNHFVDDLSSILLNVPTTFEYKESLTKSLIHISLDAYGVDRSTIRISKATTEKLSIWKIKQDEYGVVAKSYAESMTGITENTKTNYKYSVNGEGRHDLAQAKAIDLGNQKTAVSEINSYSEKNPSYTIDAELYEELKVTDIKITKDIDVKKLKRVVKAQAILGMLSVYLSYQDMQDAKEKISGANTKSLKGVVDFSKAMLEGMKSAVELSTKIREHISLSTAEGLSKYEALAIDMGIANTHWRNPIFCNGKAISYLGILSASIGMVTNMLNMAKHMGQNDPAVAASDFLNVLSSGFTAAAAIQEVAKKTVKRKVSGDLILTTAKSGAMRTVVSTSAERLFIGLAGRAVLSVIPVVNVLTFLAFACQVGSWIILLFKDNQYEAWAKASSFSKD